jgi:hypothetical protein
MFKFQITAICDVKKRKKEKKRQNGMLVDVQQCAQWDLRVKSWFSEPNSCLLCNKS